MRRSSCLRIVPSSPESLVPDDGKVSGIGSSVHSGGKALDGVNGRFWHIDMPRGLLSIEGLCYTLGLFHCRSGDDVSFRSDPGLTSFFRPLS